MYLGLFQAYERGFRSVLTFELGLMGSCAQGLKSPWLKVPWAPYRSVAHGPADRRDGRDGHTGVQIIELVKITMFLQT